MRIVDQIELLEEFERCAESHRKKALQAVEEQLWLDDRRRHEAERQEKEDREFKDIMLATSEQVARFEDQLDRYDTGVVSALMENRQGLDRAEDRVAGMRAGAFTLPDGRKVFRSENGRQVFDEAGTQLGRDVIDPAAIGRSFPSWEAWSGGQTEVQRLSAERGDLLAFQAQVDHAREQAGRKGVTQADLKTLGDDLERSMPAAMKRELKSPAGNGQVDGPLAAPLALEPANDPVPVVQRACSTQPTH